MFDGIGIGLGFTLALVLLGAIREVMGQEQSLERPSFQRLMAL